MAYVVGNYWILTYNSPDGTRWSGGSTGDPTKVNWADSRKNAFQFESVNAAVSMKSTLLKNWPDLNASDLVVETVKAE
jgi:hypothetical protein